MPFRFIALFYSSALCTLLIACTPGNTSKNNERFSQNVMSHALVDSLNPSSSSISSLSNEERFSKPEGWKYFSLLLFPEQILLPADTFVDSNIQAKKAMFALQKSPQRGIFIDERYKREFKSLDDFILNVCIDSNSWRAWNPTEKITLTVDWQIQKDDLAFYWISEACLISRPEHISSIGNFGVIERNHHFYIVEVATEYIETAQIAFFNMRDESIPVSK